MNTAEKEYSQADNRPITRKPGAFLEADVLAACVAAVKRWNLWAQQARQASDSLRGGSTSTEATI